MPQVRQCMLCFDVMLKAQSNLQAYDTIWLSTTNDKFTSAASQKLPNEQKLKTEPRFNTTRKGDAGDTVRRRSAVATVSGVRAP